MNQISNRLKMAIETTPKGTRIRFVDQSTLDEVNMSEDQLVRACKIVTTEMIVKSYRDLDEARIRLIEKAQNLYRPDTEAKVTRGEDWEREIVARRNAPKINNWHDAEALAEENNK